MFAACTQNYGGLVMDNTVASTEAMDVVMWYKADYNTPPPLPAHLLAALAPVLRAQRRRRAAPSRSRQFEMQTAAAEAMSSSAGALTGKQKIAVVQTEDEHGKVVTSS